MKYKYRISTSNEHVWCTTQLAKLSFNHSIGRTHSGRFSTFYTMVHRLISTAGIKLAPSKYHIIQALSRDGRCYRGRCMVEQRRSSLNTTSSRTKGKRVWSWGHFILPRSPMRTPQCTAHDPHPAVWHTIEQQQQQHSQQRKTCFVLRFCCCGCTSALGHS